MTAGAPAAKRGGMFGGRKHDESAVAAGGSHGGSFKLNAGAKTGLLIAELLTLLVSVPHPAALSAIPPVASSTQRSLLCHCVTVWSTALLGTSSHPALQVKLHGRLCLDAEGVLLLLISCRGLGGKPADRRCVMLRCRPSL
jgi:hypothetical protein